ncbi:hypothetical protein DFQ30_006192 [Apophysomyces sp. BC1015]|nr:hypothetical protein DFQ30_006192 [Apophysomyces sp. BC1015]KAG0167636.1 hypothetical protein DFQ29_000338 [Apophysomyces sp. BC1021]
MRVRYGYILELTSYEDKLKNEQENAPKTIYPPTGTLFEQLLTQVFPDKVIAIQFFRSACEDYGFSVIEEEVMDGDEHKIFCQWGIALLKIDEAQWQFRKLANDDEPIHNYPVPIGEIQNFCDLQDTDEEPTYLRTGKIIIKPVAGSPVHDKDTTYTQYVRYGDIVRLWQSVTSSGGNFISVKDGRIVLDQLIEDERLALRKEMKISELRSRYLQRFAQINVGKSCPSHQPVTKTTAKLSQVSLKGNVRLYLHFNWIGCSYVALSNFKGIEFDACGYCIKHMNQYAYLNNRKISQSKEYNHKKKIASILRSDDKTLHDYLKLGSIYMYGVYGMDINNEEALNYLQLAADQGSRTAFYELGNHYWRAEEHEKAFEMFEETALLSVKSVYRKLGDISRAGFSIPYETASFTIPQNHRKAFMCYSIGGVFGDATAALKIGEYYEKGHNEDFGVDHNKALQWYEYVSNQFMIPVATSAVGRIKHILANATKDLSERDELRREAYKAFEKAALDDPYAKFMMAVYNLNRWGCQHPDWVLEFDMLLSLVETGFNMALCGIAKCYEQGVGVERDLAKASAYQELAGRMDAQ